MQSFISGWVLILMMSLGAIGGSTLDSEALAFRLEAEHMYTVNGGMDLSGDEALFYIEMPQFDEDENITTAKIYATKDYMFVDKAYAIESALRMVNMRGNKSYVASENPYKEELIAIETLVHSKTFEKMIASLTKDHHYEVTILQLAEELMGEAETAQLDGEILEAIEELQAQFKEGFEKSKLEITLTPNENQGLKGEITIELIESKTGEETVLHCNLNLDPISAKAFEPIKQKDYEMQVDWPSLEVENIDTQECILKDSECIRQGEDTFVPLRQLAQTMKLSYGYDAKKKVGSIIVNDKTYALKTLNANQKAYVSMSDLSQLGFGVNWDNGYREGHIILSKPVAFGGIDTKPTLDFMKPENSYTADAALRQDVMILRTLNNIINVYRAEQDQDQFPGVEDGGFPKEGSPISYITYRTLVDEMYLEEKNINFAAKDLRWESKLVDERVKIVYDETLQQCCIEIPRDNKELMAIYEQLSEGYKKIIKVAN